MCDPNRLRWNECCYFVQSETNRLSDEILLKVIVFEPKVFLMSMMAVWNFIIFQQSKNAFWSISFLTKIKVNQNNTHMRILWPAFTLKNKVKSGSKLLILLSQTKTMCSRVHQGTRYNGIGSEIILGNPNWV